jgi:hypothetical protein
MYRALLICNSRFPDDPRELAELNGPKKDGLALRDALTDPITGMFEKDDVQLLNEADSLEACNAIEEFYQSAEPDDTLFLYYSGHGRTRNQQLFLCTRNTVAAKPYATAIPSSIVNDIISNTLAQVRIIVLDCCYGGMFKGDELVETLAGEGRYVLAATSATDRAPDSSHRGEASPFTRVFADGLRTEAADRDNDGTVDLDDLFFYLDSLSFDGLAPKRKYDGSGAVPIARRTVRRMPPSERRPVTAPLETPTPKYDNPPGPSSFLERLAYHASFSPERVSRFRASMRQDFAESMPEQLTATEFLQRAGVMHDGEITYTALCYFRIVPHWLCQARWFNAHILRVTQSWLPWTPRRFMAPFPIWLCRRATLSLTLLASVKFRPLKARMRRRLMAIQ